MMPSTRKIFAHLQARGTISPIEALAAHGCMRLAARIYDIRQAGHTVTTDIHRDHMGHPYARYTLIAA